MIKRLSPTALHTYERDRELFYCRYMSPNRPPKPPQTEPMAVGSGFDAFVKSGMFQVYYDHDDPEYDLTNLLDTQCEGDVRVFGERTGAHCWDRYYRSGCFNELCKDVDVGDRQPRFEFSLKDEIGGVPLHGKPDLAFNLKTGKRFVHDWKVNGYCGTKDATSPAKLYKYCRDTWNLADEAEWEAYNLKNTRGGNKAHGQFKPMEFDGVTIGCHWMEDVNKKWADQLCIYAWMSGIPIGNEDWVASIDQLACKPWLPKEGDQPMKPLIRVAQHRCRVSSFWQFSLLGRLQSCWNAIQSGHIFSDMTREESDNRCEVLDMQIHDDDEFWGLVSQKGQSW